MTKNPLSSTVLAVFFLGACVPATAERAVCDGADLTPEVCDGLVNLAAGNSSDEDLRLRGIIVERSGNLTHFKIPLAYTVGGDQQRLLDETVDRFRREMGRLNTEMQRRGVDLTGVLNHAADAQFASNYLQTLQSLFTTNVDSQMEIQLGRSYGRPRELSVWQRYVMPQALVFYFGTKFTANWGVGGGLSLTIFVVAQPWLSVTVDHTLPEPIVVDKSYELDMTVLGAPNVDVGFGAGGGLPIRIGAGTVLGPLDYPDDLAGWGIGLSGSFEIPVAGGGQAKGIVELRDPPLALLMAGYSSGTAAGFEVHGNIQYIMDLPTILNWIGSLRVSGGGS